MDKTRVCRADECPRNSMKTFEAADGRKILVAHAGGEYFGYQAPCPQHLWQWDVRTGGAVGLAEAPLTRHELVEEDGLLYVVPTSPAGFSPQDGEVFGWNALLEDQPSRIAAVTCLERSRVLFINGRELARVFEREPAAGYLVIRRLASLITRHLLPVGAR